MSRSQTDDISEGNLGLREVRRVYLITYSHADTRKVPSRQRFAEIVLEAFELRGARQLFSGRAVKSHIEQGEYISIWPSNSRGHRDGCQSDN